MCAQEDKAYEKIQKRLDSEAEERKIQEHWDAVGAREAAEARRKAEAKKVADRMYEQVRVTWRLACARTYVWPIDVFLYT